MALLAHMFFRMRRILNYRNLYLLTSIIKIASLYIPRYYDKKYKDKET